MNPNVINGMISYAHLSGILTLIGALIVLVLAIVGMRYFFYAEPKSSASIKEKKDFIDGSYKLFIICFALAVCSFIVLVYPANWNKVVNPQGEVYRQLYNESQDREVREAQTELDIQREQAKNQ